MVKKVGKLVFVGFVLVSLLLAGCDSTSTVDETESLTEEMTVDETIDVDASPFAGEYYVLYVGSEDNSVLSYDTFEIDSTGKVSGAVDDSGLTGFEGQIAEDGSFTAEFVRLGGTMIGTIDADGYLEAHSAVRGRESTSKGTTMENADTFELEASDFPAPKITESDIPEATDSDTEETTGEGTEVVNDSEITDDGLLLTFHSMTMLFREDGTYVFNFPSYNITEEGTWTYENDKVTVTKSNGETCESRIEDEVLKLDYVAAISDKLNANFVYADWKMFFE